MKTRSERIGDVKVRTPSKWDKKYKITRESAYGYADSVIAEINKTLYLHQRDEERNSPEGQREARQRAVIQSLSKKLEAIKASEADEIVRFCEIIYDAILQDLNLDVNPRRTPSINEVKAVLDAYSDHLDLITNVSSKYKIVGQRRYAPYTKLFTNLINKNSIFALFAPKESFASSEPKFKRLSLNEKAYFKYVVEEHGLTETCWYKRNCSEELANVPSVKFDADSFAPIKNNETLAPEDIQAKQEFYVHFKGFLDFLNQERVNAAEKCVDEIITLIINDCKTLGQPVQNILPNYKLSVSTFRSLNHIDFGENPDAYSQFKTKLKATLTRKEESKETSTESTVD